MEMTPVRFAVFQLLSVPAGALTLRIGIAIMVSSGPGDCRHYKDRDMGNDTLERLGIDDLSVEQRLDLIGEIWDSITEIEPSSIPDWHIEELKRRRAAAEAKPD